jgi:hypothetical protein
MQSKNILFIQIATLLALVAAPRCADGQQQYAEHSLLAEGQWYKIPVANSGIYKLTAREVPALKGAGCADIAVYGDAGGMLSSNNTLVYTDDMVPAAIEVVDANGNGVFEEEDYVLFYGEGAHVWQFNTSSQMFEYRVHAYANNNYYYLTLGPSGNAAPGNALRITHEAEVEPGPYPLTIASHTGVTVVHEDRTNVNAGGRVWVDNKLTSSYTQRSCTFDFPTTDGTVLAHYGFAHVSSKAATLTVGSSAGGSQSHHLYSGEDYQTPYSTFVHQGESFTLTFTYEPQESGASGYFDYVELNGTQALRYTGGQCFFRNRQLTQEGAYCPLVLTIGNTQPTALKVWDVTTPSCPVAKHIASEGSGQHYFTAQTDNARTFVAFTDADAVAPTGITPIDNQDIHGAAVPDYVIVAHADYVAQANELAELHREQDGMGVLVVTQDQVFNEFSSGRPDPIAIRRMLRCLRSKSGDGTQPRYLLLFGKGTYDNRDIMGAHQTTVVTYQSAASFGDESNIYPSDDIYGHLDDLAVGDFEREMSVGIGRLPAKNAAEARHMVDKIRRYMTRSDMDNSDIRGDWRNYVALLADDADPSCPYDSVFTSDSEITARSIKALYPHFNIDRIYADAFIQQSGADGSYYPDVNNALRQRMNYGCLLLNYIGHGSSSYIGTERYMEFSDIEKYTNTDQLTFFVTSTCSFGRYDHLQDICGAEAFLLAEAAGIGIVAASRPIHHTQRFNTSLCIHALNPDNSIGDAVRLAKNGFASSHSIALLGDPALHLSIPHNEVRVTYINQRPVDPSVTDSAKVLSRVTVEGDIVAPDGSTLTDFNGTIYPIVFDREVKCRTLANDNDSTEVDFVQQKNILYKGRDIVSNGHFSYSFIIPRDVAYSYDYAKLSHYATDGEDNATGQYGNIMFGGFNDELSITEFLPTVELFINDTNFRNGGITNETPTLYARLSDSIGINAAGCGLGHDITAIIDGNPYSTVTLNDFYEPDIDDSRKGEVRYTLGKLDEGMHTLTVKCWNIFNYSGSATVSFRVANDRTAQIGMVAAAPNPAHDRTTIRIEHNMSDQIASASITIYDIRGRQLHHADLTHTDGSYVLAYPWDFTTADGATLPKGIYIVRCTITTADGQTLSQNTKIVHN